MISKEKLQELIDQKATIWADDYGEIQLCDKSEVCNTIAFTGNHQIQEGYCLSGFVYNNEFISDNIEPDGLEENVEKGKWCYEMHASRIERFAPPVWEDFLKKKDYIFLSKNHKEVIIKSGVIMFANGTTRGFVAVENSFERFYIGDLTKENYIKACTIARKLFLGESVDGI